MNTSSTLSSSYLHPGRIDHRYYRRRGYSSHQYVRQRGETTATCTTCDHSYKSTIRKQATAFQFPLTRHQTTKPATSARSNVLERISHALHGIMVYVSVASLAKGLHNCQRALAPSISPCCGQMELLLENNKLKFPSSSSIEHKTVSLHRLRIRSHWKQAEPHLRQRLHKVYRLKLLQQTLAQLG